MIVEYFNESNTELIRVEAEVVIPAATRRMFEIYTDYKHDVKVVVDENRIFRIAAKEVM